MPRPRRKFRKGEWVTWRTQLGRTVKERILEVMEPQPGNYVLRTTLDGSARAHFLINHQQVSLVRVKRETGAHRAGQGNECEGD